jgi:polyferredoxin
MGGAEFGSERFTELAFRLLMIWIGIVVFHFFVFAAVCVYEIPLPAIFGRWGDPWTTFGFGLFVNGGFGLITLSWAGHILKYRGKLISPLRKIAAVALVLSIFTGVTVPLAIAYFAWGLYNELIHDFLVRTLKKASCLFCQPKRAV